MLRIIAIITMMPAPRALPAAALFRRHAMLFMLPPLIVYHYATSVPTHARQAPRKRMMPYKSACTRRVRMPWRVAVRLNSTLLLRAAMAFYVCRLARADAPP